MTKFTLFLTGVLLVGLMVPGLALADGETPIPDSLVFPTEQVWAAAAAALTPAVMYVLNHYAPWTSEPVKGLAQGLAAAAAAGIVQAITAGDVGFNDTTLQFIVTGLAAAVVAHVGYRAANINTALGAGSNSR